MNKILSKLSLIFLFLFLSNCTNTRTLGVAKEYKCLAPAANYYTLHALWYHKWKKI